jgi:hypothetical protein
MKQLLPKFDDMKKINMTKMNGIHWSVGCLEAGGFTAISRWLSEATPPEKSHPRTFHPGGMTANRITYVVPSSHRND